MGQTSEAPTLSKRASSLLDRVRAGNFYPWEGPGSGPKAMAELLAAGLVTVGGRVELIRSCYVPAGFVGHTGEHWPGSPPVPSGWHPIESAPTDREVDIWDGRHRVRCRFEHGRWFFTRGYPAVFVSLPNATHWREPVPAPADWTDPEATEGGDA